METLATNKEHILACLSSSPSNVKIIKTAAHMARAFGGRFTALYVKTPESEGMSRENRTRLERNIKLAQDMGADIATVYGDDVAHRIIEFARLSGATKIVLGRSNVTGGIFPGHSLTDKIIKAAPGLDIHIIPDADAPKKHYLYNAWSAVRFPSLRQWALTGLLLLLSTALGYIFHTLNFTDANTITVYMLGVLITALVSKNYICSGTFSLASVLLFNFLFVEPRLSFKAYESGYPVTFAIMLVVSLVVGTLANKLATGARLSANAAYRTNIMLQTNQLLQKSESEEAVIATMAGQLVKLLARNVVVYPVRHNAPGQPQVFPTESGGDPEGLISEEERRIAAQVLEDRKHAADAGRQKEARGIYFAVETNDAVFCVVGVEVGNKPIEHFENSILMSILGESALAMENLRIAKEKEEIALLAKNEKLRADLLRAISHDLRTPLTSISGNAENLLANFDKIDGETRKKLLTDVNEDAEWLISLVENLLSVSRISQGRMNINMSVQVVDEVITEALRHVVRKAGEHSIVADLGDEILLAKMDARLISQVIINLVENAVKYTPRGSDITVRAREVGEQIHISVEDNGPGIPDEHKKDVFRMFYTGSNTVVDCRRSLGLGLSLCESIVNAHGGRLTLEDNVPHGCIFTFTLEKSEVNFGES